MNSFTMSFKQWCNENNPDLLKEWDYSNNEKKPNEIAAFSNKKYWWICKNGHSWEAPPKTRENGHNCPYCTGHKAIPGETDLKTINPDLAAEWDYSKNEKGPEEYTAGSGAKVSWICKKCGYQWDAVIVSRKRRGCPRCNNKVVIPGINDLASQRPQLVKEWSDKNVKKPTEVFVTSNKPAIWKCKLCGNEWSAVIYSRASGTGCPVCSSRKVVPGINDLATHRPDLVCEWASENNDLRPDQFTVYSNQRVKWTCRFCKHTWTAAIADRSTGKGCPECASEYKVSTGEKTVAFYTEKVFSDMKTNYTDPKIGKYNYDIIVPSINTVIEYDGCMFHKKTEKDMKKNQACIDNGYEIIRFREKGLPMLDKCTCYEVDYSKPISLENAIRSMFSDLNKKHGLSNVPDIDITRDISQILALKYTFIKENSVATNPDLLKQWSDTNGPLSPYKVSLHSNYPIRWLCEKCGQIWIASPNTRSKGIGCGVCSNKNVIPGVNDAETRVKDKALIDEWSDKNEKSFNEVSPGSHKKAIWKCRKCGQEWKAEIKSRVLGGTGCPYCSNRKAILGVTDLASQRKDLLEEWDYVKNVGKNPEEISIGSSKKVYWKCKQGHSWSAEIYRRVQGSGCPTCYHLSCRKYTTFS